MIITSTKDGSDYVISGIYLSVGWFASRITQKVTDCLTLPYLRGGQVVIPAQRWGRISSAQCATPM